MSQSRRATAYRKSRKFGDIYGGRVRPRVPDGIFRRTHSLRPPGPRESLPILIEDNPSRDYFFPISAAEAAAALEALPTESREGITHLWLRAASSRQLASSAQPLAEFICGSGVQAIILYPWRKDLRVCLGMRQPKGRAHAKYTNFGATVIRTRGRWYAEFKQAGLRRFYVEHLLYHELGYHVDSYRRRWSKANQRTVENAANQYAVEFARLATHIFPPGPNTHAG